MRCWCILRKTDTFKIIIFKLIINENHVYVPEGATPYIFFFFFFFFAFLDIDKFERTRLNVLLLFDIK